jgi:hypothetical protein
MGFYPQHGMEEVVGSIPTRSTNQLNNLADTISSSLAAFWQQIFNGLQKLLCSFPFLQQPAVPASSC